MSDVALSLSAMNYVESDLLPDETLIEWSLRRHPKRPSWWKRSVLFVSARRAIVDELRSAP